MSDFSATNMQLFFLSGSQLLWSEVERSFSYEHAAVFFSVDQRGCFGAKLSDLSATNMQLFFSLWIEEAALERSLAIFQLRTCSCFFLSGSKRLLWSEVERFFSLEHAAVFSLWIEEAALERNWAIFQPRTCSCFFSGDRRGCFTAKLNDFFQLRNMQLFFSLWIEEAALERS